MYLISALKFKTLLSDYSSAFDGSVCRKIYGAVNVYLRRQALVLIKCQMILKQKGDTTKYYLASTLSLALFYRLIRLCMLRILLLLIIILLLFTMIWGLPGLKGKINLKQLLKKHAGWLGLLFLCLLILTGKLNVVFALFGLLLAGILRLLPLLLNYAPHVLKLWSLFKNRQYQHTEQQGYQKPYRADSLSKEEALNILGLKSGASETEIIAAHRKLIAKMHPDKGGSDYLSAQINLAKKILLKH